MKQDPTLYEPKSMFCEIASLIGPAIGAVGSLIGGSQAAGAAEDASDAQVRAAAIAAGVSREALGFQREMYNVGRADFAPYRASGAGALQTMNNMFLPGGHSMVQMQGRLNELRAQRARLMSGSQASGQAGQIGPGGVPYNGLANYSGGGDAGGNVNRDFNDVFGRDFGDTSGGANQTAGGLGAIGDAMNDDMDDDWGGDVGSGGDGDFGGGMGGGGQTGEDFAGPGW